MAPVATTSDSLARYREKRDFERTREPAGLVPDTDEGRSYCVQKHAARRLHYDFRLELDGVLKSWAIPKGPSLVPGDKRLAVATEDHPVDYGSFEGVITEGEYGGGTVLLWDRGSWEPLGDPHAGLAAGKLEFLLHGEKLHGKFVLVKLKRGEDEWLLLKSKDEHATQGGDIVDDAPRSVATARALDEIAAEEGATAKQLARARAITGSGPAVPPARKTAARKTATRKTAARAPGKPTKKRRTDDEVPAADSELPEFVEPQLATLVDTAPEGDEWLHEIKLDGYRIQCRRDGDAVTLSSRNQIEWTSRVPELVEAVRGLDCTQAVLDGELVWVEPDGRTVFGKLTEALGRKHRPNLVFFAFDLLHVDGRDLRPLPLLQRKRELQRICAGAPPFIRYCEHVVGQGGKFFAAACELGVEGIVSKRANGPYRGGRARDWLKIKCLQRQELVIVGWTPPTHEKDGFGSLVLAVHEDGELVYAGRVGTGFTRDDRQALFAKLEPLARKTTPLRERPRAPGLARVHWVEPRLVGEVAFTEWTSDGRLRHPSFQGLREDKPASAVVRERPAPTGAPTAPTAPPIAIANDRPAGVAITNANKVLFADVGITKLALADYYAAIAPAMLPHLRGRPLMLLRCPEGTSKPCFYQKHAGHALPPGVITFEVEEDDGEREVYLAVESAEGLVGTVQLGALELHVWGSRRDQLELPDRMVLDLDPDPSVPYATVAEAAVTMRDALEQAGLTSFVMSTGGKGLHVVVPLVPEADFEAVKAWSRAFAEERVREAPRRFVAQATKSKRVGKIFIDYLRNGRGATAICPFSTRARPGAFVAMPLGWDELDAQPQLSIAQARQRVGAGIDPWRGYDEVQQTLPALPRSRTHRAR